MPTTPEAIVAAITDATATGFRGRLIARGQARAMIWRDGVSADPFGETTATPLRVRVRTGFRDGLRVEREAPGRPVMEILP